VARKRVSKKASQASHKKDNKKTARHDPLLTVILICFVALFVAAFLISIWFRYPVETTYQSALNSFRARGVAETILPDLAQDFASHNQTMRQLINEYPGFEQDIKAVDKSLRNAQFEVVATVNGEPITREQLNRQTALLPQEYQDALSEEQILEEMINEEVIIQEAERLGLAPTEAEIDEGYQALLVRGQLTEEQLEQNIAPLGLTVKDIRVLLARQLTITKLFTSEVDSLVKVTSEEIRAFYDKYAEQFRIPGDVTARHILIQVQDPSEDATAQTLADELAVRAKTEDFCELVKQYSADPGSVANCGEYTFAQGVMVPEFEQAAFSMKDGELRVVKTQFGYHLIKKINETSGAQLAFDDVSSMIEERLHEQRRLEVYQAYIADLRGNATVVNHLQIQTTLNETAEEPAPELESAGVISAETQATVTITEPVAPEPAPSLTGEGTMASFAACLAEKGATLYIASWNPVSLDEKTKFGDAAADLNVIDCGQKENAQACETVAAYPAWKVGGTTVLGTLSFTELATRSGCPPPQ